MVLFRTPAAVAIGTVLLAVVAFIFAYLVEQGGEAGGVRRLFAGDFNVTGTSVVGLVAFGLLSLVAGVISIFVAMIKFFRDNDR